MIRSHCKALSIRPRGQAETPTPHAKLPKMRLKSGTLRYRHTVSMNGRESVSESTTVTEEPEEGWSVTDSIQSTLFTITETVVLAKETLHLRKQSLSGGPVRFELEYRDGRAIGTLRISLQPDQGIDCALDGELFAQGAGASHSIAQLPLELGYTRTYRNFHPAKQAITEKQLTVAAVESGAWRIEITPGPATLLIDCDTRAVLSFSTVASFPNFCPGKQRAIN